VKIVRNKCLHTDFFTLGLPKTTRIDLFKSFKRIEKDHKIKYNPDTGIDALFLKYEDLSFCIFATGTVLSYGESPQKPKRMAIQAIWDKYLRFFLIQI
tara:strand:+ start:259 stop:552 length:294 start_codon:yes stop_codon:yes gene_type:complete